MTGAERSNFAIGGLVLGAVVLLAVNLFSHTSLTGLRMDLTEEKLYTISQGTRSVLGSLKEPLTARLYFSKRLGEKSPRHGIYHDRIRELLERYSEISGGEFRLELYDPEPFSDAEDRGVASGLQGVPISASGDQAYFGLAVTSSTDLEAVIPFFALERESFIEYDLTKLVYTLANPDKKAIGLITTLTIDGREGGRMTGIRAPRKRWVIMNQIREFFNVRMIDGDATEIPDDIQTLMVVHPKGLTEGALYAVDQFIMRGGTALVFVDPSAELEAISNPLLKIEDPKVFDFNKVLAGWGIEMVPDRVAGDLDAARRVSVGLDPKRPQVADYVAWLALDKDNFDASDIITANIERIHLATAGVLRKLDGGTTEVMPLLSTGARAALIEGDKVRGERVNVVELYRNFKPGGTPLMIGARVRGDATTGFPDGPPAEFLVLSEDEEKAKADHLGKSEKPVNLIVVADVDMLYDRFWVSVREFYGQSVLTPVADNGTFVVNALDTLAGSDALIGLRGRGNSNRPFRMVEDIRKAAERVYRTKEEKLLTKLKEVRARLDLLQGRGESASAAVFTDEDQEAIDAARTKMRSIRKELRAVQHALRSDIESLEAWLKFLNIAGLPLILSALALIGWLLRRRRVPAA